MAPNGLVGLLLGVSLMVVTLGGEARADGDVERESDAAQAMQQGSDALARGEFEVAISFFRAAKLLKPESSGPRLALGLALRSNLQCREALIELEDYMRRKPKGDKRARAAIADCRRINDKLTQRPAPMPVVEEPGTQLRTAPVLVAPKDSRPSEASRPFYRRWYFWAAVGVVVAGGIVGGAVAGSRSGGEALMAPPSALGVRPFFGAR